MNVISRVLQFCRHFVCSTMIFCFAFTTFKIGILHQSEKNDLVCSISGNVSACSHPLPAPMFREVVEEKKVAEEREVAEEMQWQAMALSRGKACPTSKKKTWSRPPIRRWEGRILTGSCRGCETAAGCGRGGGRCRALLPAADCGRLTDLQTHASFYTQRKKT